MKRPISSGDMCRVINGYTGKDSPNIGLIVEVIHRVYDCPQLGIIWRCKAEFAERARDDRALVPGGLADFAQDWLRRIDDPVPPESVTTTRELAVE